MDHPRHSLHDLAASMFGSVTGLLDYWIVELLALSKPLFLADQDFGRPLEFWRRDPLIPKSGQDS